MNIMEAVYDFVVFFCPVLQADNVFIGYQNRSMLPDVQKYAVITLEDTTRIGTNVGDDMQSSANIYTTKALREYVVGIDLCSNNQFEAQELAQRLEIIGRDFRSTDFFSEYEVSCNYTEDIKYLPFVDGTEQYVQRYRVTLHLTMWNSMSVPQEYAEKVKLGRVENIDAHHKF
jgi:hypothetical protein